MRTFPSRICAAFLITTFATATQADGVVPATRASKQQPVAAPAAASRALYAPRVAGRPIVTVSPRRTALMNQLRSIREEQDRLANAVARTEQGDKASRVAQPAGVSPWPQAPFGTRAIATAAGSNASFGIHAINGRTRGVRLTPGGKVVITGLGLGEPTGVRLVGGALDRHPVLLRINWRTPTRIDAEISSTTRGSPDEQKAAVEVRTSKGATYRFDGVGFIAAREETTITDAAVIQAYVSFIDLAKDNRWRQTSTDGRGGYREDGGKDMDCGPPGADQAHFKRRFGFDVVGATMATGRTDSGDGDQDGNPGSRVFTPGYAFGDWADENFNHDFIDSPSVNSASVLSVNWGVFRSHRSPKTGADSYYVGGDSRYDRCDPAISLVCSRDAFDQCSSAWSFTSLRLYGPAGVAP